MKNLQMLFISIVFSILLIPILGFNYHEKISGRENRILAEFPHLINDNKINDKYFDSINSFVGDRFGGREQLINLNSNINYTFLGFCQMNKNAIIGKDGWYFCLVSGMSDDIMKKNLLSEAEKQEFTKKLKEVTDWYEANGIKILFVIGPEKHSVYPEKLLFERPDGITRSDQFVECIENLGFNVIFPRDYLLEKKKNTSMSLYLETDTHWNGLGAYYVFQLIKESFKEEFPEVEIPDLKYTVKYNTSLGPSDSRVLLGLKNGTNTCPFVSSEIECYKYLQNGDGIDEYIHTLGINHSLPRVLVIRDSFTGFLIQFLSAITSETIYLWRGRESGKTFSYEQILEFKPDLVIFESVERFLFSIMEKDHQY